MSWLWLCLCYPGLILNPMWIANLHWCDFFLYIARPMIIRHVDSQL